MNDTNVLGCYFRVCRKERQYTLDQTALKVGSVSKSCINEFEIGTKITSSDIIMTLFESLRLPFDFNRFSSEDCSRLTSTLSRLYCEIDMKEFENLICNIANNINYKNSFCFPIYMVALYYKTAFIDKNISYKHLSEIEKIVNISSKCMSDNEFLLYSIFRIRKHFEPEQSNSYVFLNKVLERNTIKYNPLLAVAQYLCAMEFMQIKEYAKAIELLEESIKIFNKFGYLKRLLYCNVSLALGYNEILDFRKAIYINKRALSMAKSIQDDGMIKTILNNLAITYLNINDYKNAKEYSTDLLNILDDSDDIVLILSVRSIMITSDIHLGNMEEAEERLTYLKRLLNTNTNEIIKYQVKIQEFLLRKDLNSKYYHTLQEYLAYLKPRRYNAKTYRLYSNLIHYCKEKNKLEELVHYQEELIELLKQK